MDISQLDNKKVVYKQEMSVHQNTKLLEIFHENSDTLLSK